MKVYFFSGLGANQKAFKRLKLPEGFEPVFIEWNLPEPAETLEHYVERFTDEIDVNEPFALVGLSFGGIIVQELNKFIKPEKTILISSIKDREQMPRYLKFSSKSSAHKVLPIKFFTSNQTLSYTFFRKLYDSKMPVLEEFFTHKDPYYLKWSIDKIVNWNPDSEEIEGLYQMHGTKDIIFPHKYVADSADIIPGGSHIMVLQKPKEVSKLLEEYLTQ